MSLEKFNAAAENAGEPAKIRFFYPTDVIFNSLSLRTTYRANMMKDGAGESQFDDLAISQDERDIVINEFLPDAIHEMAAELFKITEGVSLSTFVDKTIMRSDGFGKSAAIDIDGATSSATIPTSATLGEIIKMTGIDSPYVIGDYLICTTASETAPVFALKSARVAPTSALLGATLYVVAAFGGFTIGDTIVCTTASTTAPVFEKANVVASGFEVLDNTGFNANLLPSIDEKIKACIRYYILGEWYGSVGMDKDMAINEGKFQKNKIKTKNLTFQLRKPLMS